MILTFTGELRDFVSEALLFNSQIYSKYRNTSPIKLVDIIEMSIKGLDVTDKNWFNFDPFKKMTSLTDFDSWFYTGFFFRFVIMVCTAFLAVKKDYRTAAFVYLFAASLLIIDKGTFRTQPFIMVSLTVISSVISGEFWPGEIKEAMRTAQRTLALLSCLIVAWVMIKSVNIYAKNRRLLSYEANFGAFEEDSRKVKLYACGQSNVKLAIYPAAIYFHWFTDLKPVSKYLFMFPWVAEIAMGDVIRELDKKDELAIVRVDYDTPVWDKYVPKEYLSPVIEYLESHYAKLTNDTFISPELLTRCQDAEKR
jgi:hypothetical protein